jgi:hypothetical protein
MSSVDKAYQTQLTNIQKRTGKTLQEFEEIIKNSGLTKHGEIRELLMDSLGLGFGDASILIHAVLKTDGASITSGLSLDDVLDDFYSGPKTSLRPIHEAVMQGIHSFGEFEISPKKGYLSLRRKRQFAMIGPATNSRIEVGINHKSLGPTDRLLAQPPGGMCQYKVKLSSIEEVDESLFGWLRSAYELAG